MADFPGSPAAPPSLSDLLGTIGQQQVNAQVAAQQQAAAPNALVAGVRSGEYSLASNLQGLLAAAGKRSGLDGTAIPLTNKVLDFSPALNNAQSLAQSAQTQGRPDLEGQSFFGHGVGGFASKLGYTLAQGAPSMAVALAGGSLLGPATEALGAGGVAGNIAGAGLAAYPGAVTSQYLSAARNAGPDGPSASDAGRALLQGIPLAGVQGLGAAADANILTSGGLKLGLVARVGVTAGAQAGAAAIGSAAQSFADNSFNPTMSFADKANEALQQGASAAISGGIVGGLFGLLPAHAGTDQIADATKSLDPASASEAPSVPAQSQGIDGLLSNKIVPQDGIYQTSAQPADTLDAQGGADRARGLGLGGQSVPDTLDAQGATDRARGLSLGGQPVPDLPERYTGPAPTQDELDLRMGFNDRHPGFQGDLFDQDGPPADLGEGRAPAPGEAAPTPETLPLPDAQALARRIAEDRQRTVNEPTPAGDLPDDIEQQLQDFSADPQENTPKAALDAPEAADDVTKADVFRQFGDRDNAIGSRSVMREWIDKSDVKSDADLYNAMVDELATNSKVSRSASFKDMAQQVGVLGEDNKPFNVEAERAEAAAIPNDQARAAANAQIDTIVDRQARAQALREPTEVQAVGPGARPEATPPEATPATEAPPTAPKSIADRVVDAAHEITGGTGGEASIADIRAKLPDIAPADIDNALKQIHGDDTDNALTQAPKGQRNGVDGVSVQGQGRFHNLAVEPREAADAVQERSTETLGGGERPSTGAEAVDGDAGRDGPAAAQSDQVGDPVARASREAEATPAEKVVTQARRSAQTPEDASERAFTKNVTGFRDYQNAQVRRVRAPDDAAIGAPPADFARAMTANEPVPPPPAEATVKPYLRDTTEAAPQGAAPTRAEIEQHLETITAGLSPEAKARIKLIDDPSKLPDRVKDATTRAGLDTSQTPGLFDGGNAYIHANQMRSLSDVDAIVAHEVFGHMGTKDSLGGSYEGTLSKAFDNAGGEDGLVKLAKQYGAWSGENSLKPYLDMYRSADGSFSQAAKARMVDELLAHASQSTVLDVRDRAGLAFVGRVKQAIAQLFERAGMTDFAKKFQSFTASDVERFLQDSRNVLEAKPPEGTVDLSKIPDASLRAMLNTDGEHILPSLRSKEGIQDQLDDAKGVTAIVGSLSKMQEKVPTATLARAIGKTVLGIKTRQDFERSFGKLFPEFMHDGELSSLASRITDRAGQYHGIVLKQLKALKTTDRGMFDKFSSMLTAAHINNLDPTRPFNEHSWLNEKPAAMAQLKSIHNELAQAWNQLGQPGKGGKALGAQEIYRSMQAASKADQSFYHINQMHVLLDSMKLKVPGFETNAVRDIATRSDVRADPNAAFNVASGELKARIDALSKYITDQRTSKTADQGDIDMLKSTLDRVNGSVDKMNQGPYSHMGRSGDHFVSFGIKRDVDGNADPQSVQALSDAFKKNGLGDYQMLSINKNHEVYIRTQNPENAAAIRKIVKSMPEHIDDMKNVRSGSLLKDSDWQSGAVAPELKKIMDRIGEKFGDKPEYAEAKAAAQRELRMAWFDALPENSAVKGQTYSRMVQGQSGDVLANYAFRAQVASNALGRMAVSIERSEASAGIIKRIQDATLGDDHYQNVRKQDIGQAFLARNAAQTTRVPSGLFDKLRGYAHSYYLAASPGYVIMQGSQTYTLTLPELAKHFGFANSVTHMVGSIKDVGTMMAAMARVQAEVYGAWRRGEASPYVSGVSERALDYAKQMGMSQDKVDFLRQLDNMGKLEMGTFSRENFSGLQLEGKSSVAAKTMQMLNGTATNAELMARLVAAFSAKRGYDAAAAKGNLPTGISSKFATAHDYAGHVVSESMYEWGGDQTSKLFSAQGPLGVATPLVTQFHGFGTRLFNKLTHETYNAFKGETAESRAEARRFMLAHLTATTTLAGTLGLPAAAWTAAAITKASTIMPGSGGEAYDVESHFKDFVASILGKQLGEVVTNGVPRYFNADFSNLGDKDLLPMTSLLEDRRKLEDSVPAYLSQAWGSSIGAGLNGLLGARDVMNGNVMNGLARMLPTALKDQVKAYQISQYGYTDAKGNTLPIDAGTFAVLRQALGIQGGEMTAEREKRYAVEGAVDDREFHAGMIKRNIAIALERGDTDGYASGLQQAQEYDADPAHRGAPISGGIGSYIALRALARAYAVRTGLPLGTSPKDLSALQLVNY